MDLNNQSVYCGHTEYIFILIIGEGSLLYSRNYAMFQFGITEMYVNSFKN